MRLHYKLKILRNLKERQWEGERWWEGEGNRGDRERERGGREGERERGERERGEREGEGREGESSSSSVPVKRFGEKAAYCFDLCCSVLCTNLFHFIPQPHNSSDLGLPHSKFPPQLPQALLVCFFFFQLLVSNCSTQQGRFLPPKNKQTNKTLPHQFNRCELQPAMRKAKQTDLKQNTFNYLCNENKEDGKLQRKNTMKTLTAPFIGCT